MPRVFVYALLWLGAILAGCASPEGEPVAPEPLEAPAIVGKSPTLLVVWVLDEGLRPLPGAVVAFPEKALTVPLSQLGTAQVEGIEAGPELVRASHVGYFPGQVLADVVDGGTTEIKLILSADPAYIPPRIDVASYQGFIEGTEMEFCCSSGGDTFYMDCQCVFSRDNTPGLRSHVIEVVWDDSIEKPVGEPTRFRMLLETRETFDWFIAEGPSPLRVEVPVDAFSSTDTEDYTLYVYPEEDWVHWQQPFEVFWTLFVEQDAPDGWSVAG